MPAPVPTRIEPPLALLAELTHRCPLRCPYCSNPLELAAASRRARHSEHGAACSARQRRSASCRCISRAASRWRGATSSLIAAASEAGPYSNLITSGTLGAAGEIAAFEAGLKHVQLSFQDFAPANNDRIAGLAGAQQEDRLAPPCAPPACRSP